MIYLNCRSAAVGGAIVADPYVLEGDGLADPVSLRTFGWSIPLDRIEGRHVVFATHGFNVSYAKGARLLALLERDLALGAHFVVVGILWPGDAWIPVVNYPAEGDDAVQCGRLVARFANTHLRSAAAVSFVSHSLGGRLVLEAVRHLDRPAASVCLAAAAVDDDCLATQYDAARGNAALTTAIASRRDMVLRLAYPIGDFVSDLFFDDDSPWRRALGFQGPRPTGLDRVLHAQILPAEDYGHFDYVGATNDKTARVARFVRETLTGLPHAWP